MTTESTKADSAGRQKDLMHPWVAGVLTLTLLATWLLGYGPGAPIRLPWPAVRALAGPLGDASTKSAASTGAVTAAATPTAVPMAVAASSQAAPNGAAEGPSASTAGSPAVAASGVGVAGKTAPESVLAQSAPAPGAAPSSAAVLPAEPLTVLDAKTAAPAPAVAQIFFPRANASLPKGVGRSLAGVVKYLNANAGATVAVAGFHDNYGDPGRNAELARKRAQAIVRVLERQGIDKQRIALQKPERSLGSGRAAQARRVEVRVMPG